MGTAWNGCFPVGLAGTTSPATIVCGVGIALLTLSHSYSMFLFSAAFWGLGSGIGGPAPAAYVADFSPPAIRGQVFGAFRSLSDCGVEPAKLKLLAEEAAKQWTAKFNPRPLEAADFVGLYESAFNRRSDGDLV